MANDLKLIKVACLFDKGGQGEETYKKLALKYPEYYFDKLPTEDIRDKSAFCDLKEIYSAKEGFFDASGEIKYKYIDDFKRIMVGIQNYFNDN